MCGNETDWSPASGRGRLYSYVVVNRPEPGFESDAPYMVALVDLEEGPRMLGNLLGFDLTAPPAVGAPLGLEFEEAASGVRLPQWRLAG